MPVVCTGPFCYIGLPQLQRDIDNLKLTLATTAYQGAFLPSVGADPGIVGSNKFYRSEEEHLSTVADALHVDYHTIIDADFSVQIDDPFLTDLFADYPTG
ncbi:hypothetical protein BG74_08215 [Sodalis-like endosymbiont of Proechinophthirus fluctus]|uniref:hypothetical protein n=1 Tax=Sodalis-like endosymbiont of Proechinophthirus fluctus TaxID=1462730 RepID=UPI0007A9175A|nr:hypothetical protein [Sodalis-like endosymbiont of Proechinophthirus fluctus]KYP95754.1 hypothetical protein BG74_08215 [Sodalis-like endosymbiont of Proechinophthirus fluctus]